MADNKDIVMRYIDYQIRGDDHPPLGEHINVEVKLNLKGSKDGRQVDLSNTHIPLIGKFGD